MKESLLKSLIDTVSEKINSLTKNLSKTSFKVFVSSVKAFYQNLRNSISSLISRPVKEDLHPFQRRLSYKIFKSVRGYSKSALKYTVKGLTKTTSAFLRNLPRMISRSIRYGFNISRYLNRMVNSLIRTLSRSTLSGIRRTFSMGFRMFKGLFRMGYSWVKDFIGFGVSKLKRGVRNLFSRDSTLNMQDETKRPIGIKNLITASLRKIGKIVFESSLISRIREDSSFEEVSALAGVENVSLSYKQIEKLESINSKLLDIININKEEEERKRKQEIEEEDRRKREETILKSKERQARRSKEVEEEKAASLEKLESRKLSKEKKGILDYLISNWKTVLLGGTGLYLLNKSGIGLNMETLLGLGGLLLFRKRIFSLLRSITSTLLNKAGSILRTGIGYVLNRTGIATLVSGSLSAIKNTFKSVFSSVASGIGSYVGSIRKEGLIGATKGLLSRIGLTAGAKTAATVGVRFIPVIGTATAVGLAVYDLYSLVRRLFKRSEMREFFKLRAMLYGFDYDKEEEIAKRLLALEQIVDSKVMVRKEGDKSIIRIKTLERDDVKKAYELFEIDPSNDEQKRIFTMWYNLRFIKVYGKFLDVIISVSENEKVRITEYEPSNKDLARIYNKLVIPKDIYQYDSRPIFNSEDSHKITISDRIVFIYHSYLKDKYSKYLDSKTEDTLMNINRNIRREEKNKEEMTSRITRDIPKKEDTTQDITNKIMDNNINANLASRNIENEVLEKEDEKKSVPITFSESKPVASIRPSKLAQGPIEKTDRPLDYIESKVPKEKILALNPKLLDLLSGMSKEYHEKTGKKLVITEAFRTSEDQKKLRAKYGNRAAPPGRSLHEYGLAVDASTQQLNELESMGLLRKYGFTRPIGKETWHIEPIKVSMQPEESKKDPNLAYKNIIESVYRGGGGYALLPNAKEYKRDIEYQRKLYESNSNIAQSTLDKSIENIIRQGSSYASSVERSKPIEESTLKVSSTDQPLNEEKILTTDLVALKPEKEDQPLISPQVDNVSLNVDRTISSLNSQLEAIKSEPEVKPYVSYKITSSKIAEPTYQVSNVAREQIQPRLEINTKNIEDIMKKQLEVLISIDRKIDTDKIISLIREIMNGKITEPRPREVEVNFASNNKSKSYIDMTAKRFS